MLCDSSYLDLELRLDSICEIFWSFGYLGILFADCKYWCPSSSCHWVKHLALYSWQQLYNWKYLHSTWIVGRCWMVNGQGHVKTQTFILFKILKLCRANCPRCRQAVRQTIDRQNSHKLSTSGNLRMPDCLQKCAYQKKFNRIMRTIQIYCKLNIFWISLELEDTFSSLWFIL